MEIEFKHLSRNETLSNNSHTSPDISIYKPSDKFKIPTTDLSGHTEETGQLMRTKKLREMNNIPNNSEVIINKSTLQLEH